MTNDLDFERAYWGDCTNTFDEEQKHYVYGKYMGLNRVHYSFDVGGKRILDIGGGPVSMLLKTTNLKQGKVCDPTMYPQWVYERYHVKNISARIIEGENLIDEQDWDEVWIYNCLQHVDDPEAVIANALASGKRLRLFEWIDIPAHEGHPHELTREFLDRATQSQGTVVELNESGCVGRAYYTIVDTVIDYDVIWKEEKPFADRMAVWFKRYIHPKKVIDIGCGPGIHVAALRGQNVEAFGYDVDARVNGKKYLSQVSMFELNDPADLVLCIEVAEHLPESMSDQVVESVVRNVLPGGTLVWSAAHPGQGGVGHINCQPKAYWEAKLTAAGLVRDVETERDMIKHASGGYHMGWFVQNAMVFAKRP